MKKEKTVYITVKFNDYLKLNNNKDNEEDVAFKCLLKKYSKHTINLYYYVMKRLEKDFEYKINYNFILEE